MSTRPLLIASIAGGLLTTFLSKVPLVNLTSCLLCADQWLGPLFAVWLYRRLALTITLTQGVAIGTLAGLWAAIPTFLLALMSLAGAPALLQNYPSYLPVDALFAVTSHVLGMFLLVVVNVAFGAAGGVLGGLIFRVRPHAGSPPTPNGPWAA